MKRLLFSVGVLLFYSFLFVWSPADAAKSYNVGNEVQMYLDETMNTTVSTGITLASPKRNGVNHTFKTLTGGVLRFRQGSKVEDIYYTLAEVRSDNTVNLQGLTRNLCTGSVYSYVTCGDGEQFSRGAIVELNVDQRIINLKANLDRPSRTIGSGAYICGSTSQPCLFPGSFTTTQKNAFSFTNSNAFHVIFDSTLGTAQYYNPTAATYYSFGSGSIVNATLTAAGKVQLSSTGSHITRSATGSTGANNVVWTKFLTQTGGNTALIGKIPILNSSGRLPIGMLASGTADGTKFIRDDGVLATPAPAQDIESIAVITKSGAYSGYSTTDEHNVALTVSGSTSISSLAAGDAIHVKIGGSMHLAAGASVLKLKIDGNTVCQLDFATTTTAVRPWEIDAVISIREVHAAGIAKASGQAIFFVEQSPCHGSSSNPPPKVTFDNTGTEAITVTADWSSSNAANAINIDSGYITLQNTP